MWVELHGWEDENETGRPRPDGNSLAEAQSQQTAVGSGTDGITSAGPTVAHSGEAGPGALGEGARETITTAQTSLARNHDAGRGTLSPRRRRSGAQVQRDRGAAPGRACFRGERLGVMAARPRPRTAPPTGLAASVYGPRCGCPRWQTGEPP